MTAVAIRPEKLKDNIAAALGAKVRQITVALDEVTVVVAAADYLVPCVCCAMPMVAVLSS